MHDLRDAIKRVLDSAKIVHEKCKGPPEHIEVRWSVDYYTITELLAEYNIHFVEPEDEQLSLPT